ncbi:MAG: GNAT family N-acetyltransferase [Bacteroidales bacterium]|nr:GNAT family N-acetyltransferase [Bacteroidales bacterium]
MKDIISPVDISILKSELTEDKFMRHTNYGNNEIYICTAHNSPNVMKEIGRLREHTFRNAGGGTGKEADIDEYDTAEIPYQQLIVWNQKENEILGGYRFINLNNIPIDKHSGLKLATQGLLEFSAKFIKEYLPYTIELGRSFVRPEVQSTNGSRKTLFALDNLWDGLGALIKLNPNVRYFFGKVTMYTHFEKFARDLILYFMNYHFKDDEHLVYPTKPLTYFHPEKELAQYFEGNDFDENKKILSKEVRARGENIPPLINSYMSLSKTMRCFGTSINTHFGDVEETGILVTVDDIYESKKKRHLAF